MLNTLLHNFWPLVLIIVFFGGSIFVHEYGHFLAARIRGLKVERFSIGFGPKLFSWKKNGVEYRLSAFPLGGYVALPQLADMGAIEGGKSKETLPPISYADKVIVAIMGAVFNILFAIVLATVLWIAGLPMARQEASPVIGYVEPTLTLNTGEVIPGPAFLAGLKAGDKVLQVDGTFVHNFSQIRKCIALGSGRSVDNLPQTTLQILRQGKPQEVTVFPILGPTHLGSQDTVRILGISPSSSLTIKEVFPGSPAQKAGLQAKDTITDVNQEKIFSLRALNQALEDHSPHPVSIGFLRNNEYQTCTIQAENVPYTKPLFSLQIQDQETLELFTQEDKVLVYKAPNTLAYQEIKTGDTLLSINSIDVTHLEALQEILEKSQNTTLVLQFQNPSGVKHTLTIDAPKSFYTQPSKTQALIGIQVEDTPILVHENPIKQIKDSIYTTLQTLGSLISPKTDIHLNHLMGPPGIMKALHSFCVTDIRLVLWFVILLNINLAIVNLLPIPVLDGGHILFATLGLVFKQNLSPKIVAGIQTTFMVLLFSLMLYVSFFDLRRWKNDRNTTQHFQKESLLYLEPKFPS